MLTLITQTLFKDSTRADPENKRAKYWYSAANVDESSAWVWDMKQVNRKLQGIKTTSIEDRAADELLSPC